MAQTDLYTIQLLSNMHVGSGDVNFDIIDNQVQRDVITEFPTINSSSLKGAVKEFMSAKVEGENQDEKLKLEKNVFGTQEKAGAYKFFSAHLLSFPVRSNELPFFRATCPALIDQFLDTLNDFGLDYGAEKELREMKDKIEAENGPLVIHDKFEGAIIEDKKARVVDIELNDGLRELLGANLALYSTAEFKKLVNELPVLARNKLENGESKNLWYEEVVPRESKFYFTVVKDDLGEKAAERAEKFDQVLTNNNLQIGANASIGYGYTSVNKLVGDTNE